MLITPVLLAGGSGTRLWPASRKAYPKQFVPLTGENTLFQASALRLSGEAPGYRFAAPVVVTGSDFRFIATEQLAAIGVDPGTVLIEPEGRNTAPAILAAALCALDQDPQAVLLVAPSDHVVPDAAAFRDATGRGLEAVRQGQMVLFGVAPNRPETGYGWLELTSAPDGEMPVLPLRRFVEKPDATRAAQMLAAGNYLWNAGIFLFRAADILAAAETHAPDLVAPVRAAVKQARPDLGFFRLAPEPWARLRDISIDYAVMEKADNLAVVPYGAGWSDLGGWDAIWRDSPADAQGTVTTGPATALDCRNSLLRSDSPGLELVGIGLEDIMAIATPDAVLVAHMSRAQEVKQAVEALKARGAPQAVQFPRDYRPWGWFETLALADRFQVKRIVVKPGGTLSLQSHFHRAEHWIVVSGTARVTIDDEVRLLAENQSVYIPLGVKHRMENPGKVPMVLIEVQTGAYLGEDDIIRFEDVYARGQGAKG
ncbi:mannose-1-phosphate guanylyltransferase/mannose-6-phosphate isomerase [Gemmobacter nanjingensis]|uniref:mannose-1-phosphate guanylyltransferase n=1 Tax=Gemmobacter nanjingensis TaxID=488454 RepID=A0ABQ3FRR6_9RHOB|nr:mannose-1-phosphate guanylyltransferase/mannose-6-phosphate isomerase [Gemmobacter nanjingensis]GHC36150.1 mannose-1-phosphate guanylyltransferase/mannose-6-phosphate isomerase [Gemmobacter nanjingensis]